VAGLAAGLVAVPVIIIAVAWVSRLAEFRLSDGHVTADPARQLRHLCTTALAGAVCYAAAIAVVLSWWLGPGPKVAVMTLAATLIPLRMSAWSTFVSTRIETAFSRKLPWRFMKFLDDATTLGVLRRTGSAYHFRHDRIRAKLAEQFAQRQGPSASENSASSRKSAKGKRIPPPAPTVVRRQVSARR
jgi:hypothetical protein